MVYQYCSRQDFSGFAAGRVLVHRPGGTNFPARLAQELFLRCLSYSPKKEDLTLLDPCCGNGYLLTVLGFLNGPVLGRILGGDLDPGAVAVASQNLALLTRPGLTARRDQLSGLFDAHRKPSHLEALQSADRLLALLPDPPVPASAFVADALDADSDVFSDAAADIVVTDVPYGLLTAWAGGADSALERLLRALTRATSGQAVIALCSDKGQKLTHIPAPWRRLERQLIGKRRFEILTQG